MAPHRTPFAAFLAQPLTEPAVLPVKSSTAIPSAAPRRAKE